MTATEYERMGQFIYGAHRLDGVLASMHSWMAERMGGPSPGADECPADERCVERTAVAKAYFAAHVPGEPVGSFVQLIENVRDLESATATVQADTDAERGDALRRLHAAHIGLADAIDQLGYHARTAAGLRERAAELPIAIS